MVHFNITWFPFVISMLIWEITRCPLSYEKQAWTFRVIVILFCAENNFENVHQSRTLKQSHGAVWERCDFELAHSPYAWLPLYIFCIFILFVGKSIQPSGLLHRSMQPLYHSFGSNKTKSFSTYYLFGWDLSKLLFLATVRYFVHSTTWMLPAA